MKAAKRRLPPLSPVRSLWLTPGSTIDIWGDGLQTRSFMFVPDCVEGLLRLMASNCREPLNLGTEEMVSVDELVDMVCDIAGKKLIKRHELTVRKECGAETATTPACALSLDGSRQLRCARALP